MTKKRKQLSKRVRFEVFKRDSFKCMYCGAHPPAAVLHVDHVIALAAGGSDDPDNLVTACDTCNLGKGARDLSVAPQSLADKAAEVAEREEQLRGYQAVLEARRQRLDDEAWRVLDMFHPNTESVPRDQFNSVRRFVDTLGVHVVMDAAEVALTAGNVSYRNVFRYFCGVCWNRIRERSQ